MSSVIRPLPTGFRSGLQPSNLGEYERAQKALEPLLPAVAELGDRAALLYPQVTCAVTVNSCSLFWKAGSPANFSAYLSLRRLDGSNLLSYCGGGGTPEEALESLERGLANFTGEQLQRLMEEFFFFLAHQPEA